MFTTLVVFFLGSLVGSALYSKIAENKVTVSKSVFIALVLTALVALILYFFG